MKDYFKTEELSVGYDGRALLQNIDIALEKGRILTLIGPNGGGKSTILKSITRHLQAISGRVFVGGRDLSSWQPRELAKQVAVVLTDRVKPELTTCAQVVALGRYPHTGIFGKLTKEDNEAVYRALERVHGLNLADKDFASLSDGQRQRILLARALCQEPEIIVLDEPTAYLDIRYKLELLEILRQLAREKGITVILSLHEIDLAAKISDYLLCVQGQKTELGTPEQLLQNGTVERLYSMEKGRWNSLLGSVELPGVSGAPQVFVVAGGGYGIPMYRQLQKQGVSFATGILFENDVDFQVAGMLSSHVISCPAFEEMTEQSYDEAAAILKACPRVIDAGTPKGKLNEKNRKLLELAKNLGKAIESPLQPAKRYLAEDMRYKIQDTRYF